MAMLITDPAQVSDPNSIIGYWNGLQQQQPPYLYQGLTNAVQIDGDHVSEYFGQNQAVTGLDGATDDTQAPRHNNIGFATDSYKLLGFRSSKMMDETRQNAINNALALHSNDSGFVQSLAKSQMNDLSVLLTSAQYTREKLFIAELLTGKLTYNDTRLQINPANYDFHVPAQHHLVANVKWGTKDSEPVQNLEDACRFINRDNNTTETIAIMNQTTLDALASSGEIKSTLFPNQSGNSNVAITTNQATTLVTSDTKLKIMVYDKGDGKGTFIPDGKVILIPNTNVGRMAWTQTNETIDARASSNARISNTSDGITAETYHRLDPSGTVLLVSEKVLPVLDESQNILTLDVLPKNSTSNNDFGSVSVVGSNPSTGTSTGSSKGSSTGSSKGSSKSSK